MKKKIAMLLITILSVTSLAGCQTKEDEVQGTDVQQESGTGEAVNDTGEEAEGTELSQEPVTLRIYCQYSDADTKEPMDYAISELAKEMPWVTLEKDIEAQDNGEKLKTYAATGDMPDIFNCNYDQINTFIRSGDIAVLNDYVEETGYADLIQESNKNLLYHPDGNVYAFPFAGNEFVLMYYNTELFEQYNLEVPQTFDDLLTVVKTFNEAGITPISIFAQEGWASAAMYDEIATKYIPDGIKGLDDGTTDISDEGYLKAAVKLKELVDAGAFAKGATGMNYDQAASLFYENKAAMFISGQWFISDADKNLPGKVDWFYFPTTDDGGNNHFAMSGGGTLGGYAVSASTPDKKLAANVAAFISKKVAEYKYVERANMIVSIKIDKPINVEITPMIQKLSDEIPNFTSTSTFSWGIGNAKFKATLEEQTQAMIAGNLEPEELIDSLEASLQ